MGVLYDDSCDLVSVGIVKISSTTAVLIIFILRALKLMFDQCNGFIEKPVYFSLSSSYICA